MIVIICYNTFNPYTKMTSTSTNDKRYQAFLLNLEAERNDINQKRTLADLARQDERKKLADIMCAKHTASNCASKKQLDLHLANVRRQEYEANNALDILQCTRTNDLTTRTKTADFQIGQAKLMFEFKSIENPENEEILKKECEETIRLINVKLVADNAAAEENARLQDHDVILTNLNRDNNNTRILEQLHNAANILVMANRHEMENMHAKHQEEDRLIYQQREIEDFEFKKRTTLSAFKSAGV